MAVTWTPLLWSCAKAQKEFSSFPDFAFRQGMLMAA